MSGIFHKFSYYAKPSGQTARGRAAESTTNDETVAREYLNDALSQDGREVMRGIAAPERAGLVPGLRLTSSSPLKTGGKLLRFDQLQQDRPIFGAAATVELAADQMPVAAVGSVAQVTNVPKRADLSESQALAKIADYTGKTADELEKSGSEAAHLYYFRKDEADSWHLAYLFKEIPALPKAEQEPGDAAFDASPRDLPLADYLVDANTGAVLFYYGSGPTMGPGLTPGASYPIPVVLKGIDALGATQKFYGNKVGNPPEWELHDVDRRIKTYDSLLQNILVVAAAPPTDCVRYNQPFFNKQPAAVSAHVNASRVFLFYQSQMNRNSIDNKGMDLISMVNCTYGTAAPVWQNAMWWKDRMWYGQKYGNDQTTLHSYSQYLDVIAHELTHGVTKNTANLVYQGQSGSPERVRQRYIRHHH
jgi:Zn-dependent metalloprotease